MSFLKGIMDAGFVFIDNYKVIDKINPLSFISLNLHKD